MGRSEELAEWRMLILLNRRSDFAALLRFQRPELVDEAV
jgi:hypothetical protein